MKEIKIEKMNCKCEGKMFIFYNLSQGKGIKRMRPLNFTTLKLGDLVKINNEIFILLNYFNEGEMFYLKEIPEFNDLEQAFQKGGVL